MLRAPAFAFPLLLKLILTKIELKVFLARQYFSCSINVIVILLLLLLCYGKLAEVTKSLCNLIVCDDEMKLCLVRNVACISP